MDGTNGIITSHNTTNVDDTSGSSTSSVKSGTKKVTMNLTERDIQNTTELQRIIHARSKAGAVSYSLSLAAMLASQIEQGAEIYIKDKSGETHKLLFTGV